MDTVTSCKRKDNYILRRSLKIEEVFGEKKYFLILFTVLLVVCAIAIGFSNKQWKILRFVTKNISALEEIAMAYFDGDDSVKEYQGVKVEGIFKGEHSIVEFYYGGYGITPSSTYYGFYYSPDDV